MGLLSAVQDQEQAVTTAGCEPAVTSPTAQACTSGVRSAHLSTLQVPLLNSQPSSLPVHHPVYQHLAPLHRLHLTIRFVA